MSCVNKSLYSWLIHIPGHAVQLCNTSCKTKIVQCGSVKADPAWVGAFIIIFITLHQLTSMPSDHKDWEGKSVVLDLCNLLWCNMQAVSYNDVKDVHIGIEYKRLLLGLHCPHMQVTKSNSSSDGYLRDMCDGSYFREHRLFQAHPDALQLQLFYDDMEVVNPLGTKTKKHKLCKYNSKDLCTLQLKKMQKWSSDADSLYDIPLHTASILQPCFITLLATSYTIIAPP